MVNIRMKLKNISNRYICWSRKAQGLFGMSFSMIFSILLIVFFIAAAFIAIRFFLNYQRNIQIGLFYEELQTEIDRAWNSQSTNFEFNSTLPSGIKYACFVNMSAEASGADAIEKEIYSDVKFGSYNNNFALWPVEKAGALSHKAIKHIGLPDTNPYCIPVTDGKISIVIEKSFEEPLVGVG